MVAMAAAAMAGARLIPAPQQTSVGVLVPSSKATVSTAARKSHAGLSGPSMSGFYYLGMKTAHDYLDMKTAHDFF